MNKISYFELYCRIIFIVFGIFMMMYNTILLEYNFLRGEYVWIMNMNAIGEAQLEGILFLIIVIPFIFGAGYYIKDTLKIFDKWVSQ